MTIIKLSIYWGIVAALTVNSYCMEQDDTDEHEHTNNSNSSMQTIPKPEAAEFIIQAVPEPEFTVRAWTEEDQKRSDDNARESVYERELAKGMQQGAEFPFFDAEVAAAMHDIQQKDKK